MALMKLLDPEHIKSGRRAAVSLQPAANRRLPTTISTGGPICFVELV
jgi:hypothetical protein